MYTEKEPYLATPGTDSCWQTWHNSTVQRLHRRQTRSHGAEGWKDASEDNKWLCNVQLFPKVWILEILIKAFRISGPVSGSRLKAVFGYSLKAVFGYTHYPAGYPAGKPDSDHLWYAPPPLSCLLRWVRSRMSSVVYACWVSVQWL